MEKVPGPQTPRFEVVNPIGARNFLTAMRDAPKG